MSEIWMYGPDYADDDELEEDDEEEEEDYFELPPLITTTLQPTPEVAEPSDKRHHRMDITITMKKVEVNILC